MTVVPDGVRDGLLLRGYDVIKSSELRHLKRVRESHRFAAATIQRLEVALSAAQNRFYELAATTDRAERRYLVRGGYAWERPVRAARWSKAIA